MNTHEKPSGFEKELATYAAVLFDMYSGEPVGWGFKIVAHLGEERFRELSSYGEMECVYPTWYVVTETLSREAAIKKYGEITAEEFGPRGGWRSVTFGNTKFGSKYLKPIKK